MDRQTRLTISARVDKQTYSVDDAATFEIVIRNTGAGPIYIYERLGLGDCCSLEVLVFDATGKQLLTNPFAHNFVDLPPERTEFMRLFGKHFIGRHFTLPLRNYFLIEKPGRYTFVLEYHNPVPERDSFGLDVWSKEMGSIYSNPIQIEVIATK